ncbi:hypothetical protein [Rhizobium sp. 768_B6_N1_8]|uniref:hypothetical protein n=1 Tax=unclassified Rhizobium TaxID=2613769 RepID=UPI003F1F24A0
MTIESKISMSEMLAMRQAGAEFEDIAAKAGLKWITVYQRMRRAFGTDAIRARRQAANDNNPNRATMMMPRNGGCSTTSGEMPVSVKRIPTLDKAEVEPSDRELLLAGLEMQVAA